MRRISRDKRQVRVLRRRDLAYWTKAFGVTVEELKMAVFRVGTRRDAVAEELGKQP